MRLNIALFEYFQATRRVIVVKALEWAEDGRQWKDILSTASGMFASHPCFVTNGGTS